MIRKKDLFQTSFAPTHRPQEEERRSPPAEPTTFTPSNLGLQIRNQVKNQVFTHEMIPRPIVDSLIRWEVQLQVALVGEQSDAHAFRVQTQHLLHIGAVVRFSEATTVLSAAVRPRFKVASATIFATATTTHLLLYMVSTLPLLCA